jgi:hypothetical protein
VAHDHGDRNHQGLGNCLIIPDQSDARDAVLVRRRERPGGMVNYDDLQAASGTGVRRSQDDPRQSDCDPGDAGPAIPGLAGSAGSSEHGVDTGRSPVRAGGLPASGT